MVERIFPTMNTVAQIKIEGNDEKDALNQAEAIIADCEKKFSFFSKESEVRGSCKKINVGERYNISPDLFEMLKAAKRVKRQTGGLFDVDFKNKDTNKDFHLENENIIIFDSNKTKLNLGAIAKGFAADKAMQKIKEFNVNRAMISMGGQVTCFTNDEPWRIGLQNPFEKFGQLVGTIEIANESISTSAENYRGEHIINPVKSAWESTVKSLSVISENGMLADAYSTSLFLADKKNRKMLIEKHNLNVIIIDGFTVMVPKKLAKSFKVTDNNFEKKIY